MTHVLRESLFVSAGCSGGSSLALSHDSIVFSLAQRWLVKVGLERSPLVCDGNLSQIVALCLILVKQVNQIAVVLTALRHFDIDFEYE